jgi:GAF domain-containing protein
MSGQAKAVELVGRIEAVPTILDTVCQITGMGFAAVARVTDTEWVACAVRDDIDFGLRPGGDLKLDTTICNEIRDSRQSVIITDTLEDPTYRDHHTPRMYSFRSYISFPIELPPSEWSIDYDSLDHEGDDACRARNTSRKRDHREAA